MKISEMPDLRALVKAISLPSGDCIGVLPGVRRVGASRSRSISHTSVPLPAITWVWSLESDMFESPIGDFTS